MNTALKMNTATRTIGRTATLAAMLCALGAGGVRAQTYVNQPVDISYYYPNTSTFLFDTGSKTVTAGGTDFGSVSGVDVVVAPSRITLTNAVNFPLTFTPAAFNGYGISETDAAFPSVVGVSLDPSTTLAGFTASRVTFSPTSVFANFQGLTLGTADRVVVNVTFGPNINNPVPEASPAASLGLLLALGTAALVVARRRKAAR